MKMNYLSRIFPSFAFLGLCMCSGCALVPFPISRTLPNPIRQIEVVQEDTGQTISNAEVVIYADRFENWMRSFPPFYAAAYTPPAKTSLIIPLKQAAIGQFTSARMRVWRYDRLWGFGPLGPIIYEDYTLTISARADDYNSVTATYYPTGGFGSGILPRTDFSFPRLDTNGTLKIFLRRNHTE